MADLIVVYWRDIPAQVIVKKGRQNAKRELPLRFTEAIDMCAMRTGAGGTDDYLAEWRKADPVPVGDDLEAEVEKAFHELDAKYDRERLVALVKAGGKKMSDKEPAVTQATLVKKAAPKSDYKPADVSPQRRVQRSFAVRLWSIRHSRLLEWFYSRFADAFLLLHPLWKGLGYGRVEAPIKFVEKRVKGFMFDCRMCGQCILSSTGMSCPMNCPKQLRNGPCGGVRANGNCEVEPNMPCVWVKAWEGSQNMVNSDKILAVQKPVDQSLRETSAWLRVTAQAAAAREATANAGTGAAA